MANKRMTMNDDDDDVQITYFQTETALNQAHPTKFVTVTKTRDTNLMLSNKISTKVQMLENA